MGRASYRTSTQLTPQSKSGSTVRIAWRKRAPDHYAMYFVCHTNLVGTFRSLFPKDFHFEGNRALVFHKDEPPPHEALVFCIRAALAYHLAKAHSA